MNIIEEYLAHFSGSVIFVSHDRYFVDKLASKLLIFEGEGAVSVAYVSYSEYLEARAEISEIESISDTASKAARDPHKGDERGAPQSKLSYKEKLALEVLPSEIDELEARIADLESDLANPEAYQIRGIATLASELEALKSELDSKLERYFALEQKAWELQNAKT